jgi:hypothetical protein
VGALHCVLVLSNRGHGAVGTGSLGRGRVSLVCMRLEGAAVGMGSGVVV